MTTTSDRSLTKQQQTVRVTARVRVTIDVPLTQPWDKNCPLEQVFDQAKRQAIGIVERTSGREYVIVGDPVVTAVFVPEDAR